MNKANIKIFISYDKGATINRIFAYANVLSEYFHVEVVMLAVGKSETHRYILDNKVQLTYKIWDGNVPNNFFARFVKEYKLVRTLSKEVNGSEDIVMVSIPFFALLFLPFFKKNKALKVLDIRDLNWEYLPSTSPILRGAKKTMSYIAKKYIQKFDEVIVTNDYEEKWVQEKTHLRPALIHNGISRDQFLKLVKNKNSHKSQEKMVISYIGNVGIAQNLLSFIEVVKDYQNFEFHIVGDGSDYNRLTAYVQENQIKNVVFHGRVSFSEIPSYYFKADILFAKLDPNYKTAVPSKLFEILATNKPLIYSGEGVALNVLNKFDNIYYYKTNEDLKAVLNNIRLHDFQPSLNNAQLVEEHFIREKMVKNNLKIFMA